MDMQMERHTPNHILVIKCKLQQRWQHSISFLVSNLRALNLDSGQIEVGWGKLVILDLHNTNGWEGL